MTITFFIKSMLLNSILISSLTLIFVGAQQTNIAGDDIPDVFRVGDRFVDDSIGATDKMNALNSGNGRTPSLGIRGGVQAQMFTNSDSPPVGMASNQTCIDSYPQETAELFVLVTLKGNDFTGLESLLTTAYRNLLAEPDRNCEGAVELVDLKIDTDFDDDTTATNLSVPVIFNLTCHGPFCDRIVQPFKPRTDRRTRRNLSKVEGDYALDDKYTLELDLMRDITKEKKDPPTSRTPRGSIRGSSDQRRFLKKKTPEPIRQFKKVSDGNGGFIRVYKTANPSQSMAPSESQQPSSTPSAMMFDVKSGAPSMMPAASSDAPSIAGGSDSPSSSPSMSDKPSTAGGSSTPSAMPSRAMGSGSSAPSMSIAPTQTMRGSNAPTGTTGPSGTLVPSGTGRPTISSMPTGSPVSPVPSVTMQPTVTSTASDAPTGSVVPSSLAPSSTVTAGTYVPSLLTMTSDIPSGVSSSLPPFSDAPSMVNGGSMGPTSVGPSSSGSIMPSVLTMTSDIPSGVSSSLPPFSDAPSVIGGSNAPSSSTGGSAMPTSMSNGSNSPSGSTAPSGTDPVRSDPVRYCGCQLPTRDDLKEEFLRLTAAVQSQDLQINRLTPLEPVPCSPGPPDEFETSIVMLVRANSTRSISDGDRDTLRKAAMQTYNQENVYGPDYCDDTFREIQSVNVTLSPVFDLDLLTNRRRRRLRTDIEYMYAYFGLSGQCRGCQNLGLSNSVSYRRHLSMEVRAEAHSSVGRYDIENPITDGFSPRSRSLVINGNDGNCYCPEDAPNRRGPNRREFRNRMRETTRGLRDGGGFEGIEDVEEVAETEERPCPTGQSLQTKFFGLSVLSTLELPVPGTPDINATDFLQNAIETVYNVESLDYCDSHFRSVTSVVPGPSPSIPGLSPHDPTLFRRDFFNVTFEYYGDADVVALVDSRRRLRGDGKIEKEDDRALIPAFQMIRDLQSGTFRCFCSVGAQSGSLTVTAFQDALNSTVGSANSNTLSGIDSLIVID